MKFSDFITEKKINSSDLKKLESKVLKVIRNLFKTEKFPSCGSEAVDGTNLKVMYSCAESADKNLFSFSIGYFKNGALIARTEKCFHLEDGSDFLDLDLSKTIEDLILKAEKKMMMYKDVV